MIKELYEGVKAFMRAGGQEHHCVGTGEVPSISVLDMRERLIQEEFDEYKKAVQDLINWTGHGGQGEEATHKLAAIADALCDLLYVTVGAGIVWGLDLPAMVAEVHRANMTKFPCGAVYKREDGKVVKPPDWKPPDLAQFLPEVTIRRFKSSPNVQSLPRSTNAKLAEEARQWDQREIKPTDPGWEDSPEAIPSNQARALVFKRAARLWEDLTLPPFQVKGYLDGVWTTWSVPNVLRTAANRLRLLSDHSEISKITTPTF